MAFTLWLQDLHEALIDLGATAGLGKEHGYENEVHKPLIFLEIKHTLIILELEAFEFCTNKIKVRYYSYNKDDELTALLQLIELVLACRVPNRHVFENVVAEALFILAVAVLLDLFLIYNATVLEEFV